MIDLFKLLDLTLLKHGKHIAGCSSGFLFSLFLFAMIKRIYKKKHFFNKILFIQTYIGHRLTIL